MSAVSHVSLSALCSTTAVRGGEGGCERKPGASGPGSPVLRELEANSRCGTLTTPSLDLED